MSPDNLIEQWEEIKRRYRLQEETQKYLPEYDVITSMRRHIGYSMSQDSGEFDAEKDPFDIVYEVTIVVRDNPLLKSVCKNNSESQLFYQMLYGAANEVLILWMECAKHIYRGDGLATINWNDSKLNMSGLLPYRPGTPHITVWGDVMDKHNRVSSLTISENSTAQEVLMRMNQQTWLYSCATDMNMGINYDTHGASPYRGISKGKKNKRGRKNPKRAKAKQSASDITPLEQLIAQTQSPSDKSESSTTDNSDDNTSNTNAPVSISKKVAREQKRKKQGKYCYTVSDIKDVENGRSFTFRVGAIEINTNRTGKEVMRLYGLEENASGDLELYTDECEVFFYTENEPAVHNIIERFPILNTAETPVNVLGEIVEVTGKKSVSKSQKAYYSNIKLES